MSRIESDESMAGEAEEDSTESMVDVQESRQTASSSEMDQPSVGSGQEAAEEDQGDSDNDEDVVKRPSPHKVRHLDEEDTSAQDKKAKRLGAKDEALDLRFVDPELYGLRRSSRAPLPTANQVGLYCQPVMHPINKCSRNKRLTMRRPLPKRPQEKTHSLTRTPRVTHTRGKTRKRSPLQRPKESHPRRRRDRLSNLERVGLFSCP